MPRSVVKGREWYQDDEVAAEYEDKRFSGGGRLIDDREKDAVLDALDPADDDRILELACGTGRFTATLADAGAEVVGLDVSGPMLRRGARKAAATGVADRVSFCRGDAARLPFPDDAFDAALAMRFFHLADRPVTFLRELRRVTDGPIVFDTFRRYSTRSIYTWLLPMGSRLYSRREVDQLVADADCELVDEAHDFVLPYGLYRALPFDVAHPLRRLDLTIGEALGELPASVSYWTIEQ